MADNATCIPIVGSITLPITTDIGVIEEDFLITDVIRENLLGTLDSKFGSDY